MGSSDPIANLETARYGGQPTIGDGEEKDEPKKSYWRKLRAAAQDHFKPKEKTDEEIQ